MQYLIDTNICIFALRGKLDLGKIIKQKGIENCFISEITKFELYYGAENSNDIARSRSIVKDFIAGLNLLPIHSSINQYAKEKVRLRRAGTPMHDEFDLLIGVTAKTHNLILVTDNIKDFKYLEGIEIENWYDFK
jgi:tRNA(fMet)-specific endonuclease VapC